MTQDSSHGSLSPSALADSVGVSIAGAGLAVPERRVHNEELAKTVDTSDEWIRPRTGIVTRHIADEKTRTTDLAVAAAKQGLDRAGLAPTELDLLICATMTPDMVCPATACQVTAELGASPAGAMDVNMACTGLVGGLSIAHNFILAGAAKNVVVVGADRLSSLVNWQDRRTCILFGDAAGAAVVSRSDDPAQGCLYQALYSDGNKAEALYVPRDEGDLPGDVDPQVTSEAGWNGQYDTLQMNGQAVFKFAVNALRDTVNDALKATGLAPDDIKMVIPHQSNYRIMEAAWKRLGFDDDKIYVNIDRYGNTSAASVGLCLSELLHQGRIGQGDKVIFVAQGGGLTWGASLWQL